MNNRCLFQASTVISNTIQKLTLGFTNKAHSKYTLEKR